jgi:hypothetical protein
VKFSRSSQASVPRLRPHLATTTAGTIGGMRKTTLYLPDDLKEAVERRARQLGRSEAEVLREAIAAAVQRPGPRAGVFSSGPFAERADELLEGLGER